MLKAKKIIHTVGPIWMGGKIGEAGLLDDCYQNSFELAKEHNLKTIAFPAISTGVYGYPIREATEIALKKGIAFEKDFDEIRYICFSDEDLAIYKEVWKEISL